MLIQSAWSILSYDHQILHGVEGEYCRGGAVRVEGGNLLQASRRRAVAIVIQIPRIRRILEIILLPIRGIIPARARDCTLLCSRSPSAALGQARMIALFRNTETGAFFSRQLEISSMQGLHDVRRTGSEDDTPRLCPQRVPRPGATARRSSVALQHAVDAGTKTA